MESIIKDEATRHRVRLLIGKIAEMVEEELNPAVRVEPVYGLGSPDPISFASDKHNEMAKTYYSFSGIDVKLVIDDESVAEGQEIKWEYQIDTANPTTPKVIGEMTVALFLDTYNKLAEWCLSGMVHTVKLQGANGFGQVMRIVFKIVKFKTMSTGISIDDLFCSAKITFTAQDMNIEVVETDD